MGRIDGSNIIYIPVLPISIPDHILIFFQTVPVPPIIQNKIACYSIYQTR